MNVILLEKVHNLGNLGDTVKVKPGYGRNFLIPKGIAVPASKENIAKFESRRQELEKIASEKLSTAQARRDAIANISVKIARKAGDEGKLFGSVGTSDIAHAVTDAGVPVEKREVRLPNGPLREVGVHKISIELHGDVVADIELEVVAE